MRVAGRLSGELGRIEASIVLQVAAHEEPMLVREHGVDLRNVRGQLRRIRGRPAEGCAVQAITCYATVGQRIEVQGGQRIWIVSGAPGACAVRRALGIHSCDLGGVECVSLLPVAVVIADAPGAGEGGRYRHRFLNVFRRPLLFDVQEIEKMVLLYRTTQSSAVGVADELARDIREPLRQLRLLVEPVIGCG